MAKRQPANLRRGIGQVSSAIAEELNAAGKDIGMPDIGTRLVSEINRHLAALNSRVEARAGHHGTVTIATQKKTVGPALDLQGGSAVGFSSQPRDGSEPITLEYWRKHEKDCQWFERMFDECIELNG